MTVWIVFIASYDGDYVAHIFNSQEKAEAKAKELRESKRHKGDTIQVYDYEVE